MALFPMLVGVVIWVKTARRIPIFVAVGLGLLTLLVIPVIGALPTEGRYENYFFHSIAKSSANASVSAALTERRECWRLRCKPFLRRSVSHWRQLSRILTDHHSEYRYTCASLNESPRIMNNGPSFTEGLLRLSPGVRASVKILGVEDALYENSGVGFSAVAERYFNFGYVTVRNEFGNFIAPASYMAVSLLGWLMFRRFTPFARAHERCRRRTHLGQLSARRATRYQFDTSKHSAKTPDFFQLAGSGVQPVSFSRWGPS